MADFVIGKFFVPDWRARFIPGYYRDFVEVPGYHMWNAFFAEVTPHFVPETEEEHMDWCERYYDWAIGNVPKVVYVNGVPSEHSAFEKYKGPRMQWKDNAVPTILLAEVPTQRERERISLDSRYCSFSPNDKKVAVVSDKERIEDIRAFYWIVLMQLGRWQPVSREQMETSAEKLRELCGRPLFQLFNISCAVIEPICVEEIAARHLGMRDFIPIQHIKEMILWHKLMVDLVVHHDIRLKIQK